MSRSVAPSLLRDLQELQESGLASRPWLMAGRYLSLCQACPAFSGSGYPEHPADLDVFLCDATRFCDRWPAIHGGDVEL